LITHTIIFLLVINSINIEYDFFETKKNMIDMEISKIQTNIICGNLTLDDYKKQLSKQLSYEEKLLENINIDTELKEVEKNKVNEPIK